ncbi:MAG: sugar-binding transcriptional regulator [Rhodospirillaceae bacterium]|nr:sugar-binding transcriptional regulator [Rhodospirillaceae bacterium]
MAQRLKEGPATPRTRRSAILSPAEFGGDPLVWAAWLYYEERMTQEEIADRLGISRATVVNFLQEARNRGIVTIAVSPDHLTSVRLARMLARIYGLQSCAVIPDDGGRLPDYERIGQAGARLLAQMLRPNDTLGVSWGRTVLALSKALPAIALPHVSVVQVTGSAIGTYEFSAELCTSNIASRIGARCVNLHAPGIVSRPQVKTILMREPTLVEQFRIIRSCNKILFGVTNVAATSMAIGSGYLTEDQSRPYIERGAIGVLAGRFFDRRGRPVLGELDERMIGITLDELAGIPERICVAGGLDKVPALHAALSARYATVLVTDERTARDLVGMEARRGAPPGRGAERLGNGEAQS